MEELKEKVLEIEKNLIEQEHRPFTLIWNYMTRKRRWKDENDPRRKAATKAIIWRLFASPTTIAVVSGGAIGLATIFLLIWQNRLIDTQNLRINQQTYLIEADRRAAQVFIMGDVLSDLNQELIKKKDRKERIISKTLVGRIVSLSNAMKPYKYMDGDKLIGRSVSPERGQLLTTLIESKLDTTFFKTEILEKCDFSNADLSGATIIDVDLSMIDLENANFSGTELFNVNLSNANLKGAKFSNSTFFDVDFRGANLTNSYFKSTEQVFEATLGEFIIDKDISSFTNLTNAKFDSVLVYTHDWDKHLKDERKLIMSDTFFIDHYVDTIYDIDPLQPREISILINKKIKNSQETKTYLTKLKRFILGD